MKKKLKDLDLKIRFKDLDETKKLFPWRNRAKWIDE